MLRNLQIAVIILLLSIEVLFAVPGLMNYRGKLYESGTPVTGIRNIRFMIFDTPTGPGLLWDSGVQVIQVNNGYYNYTLGTNIPIPSNIFTNDFLYLEVEVEGTALSPRERLVSVGYSFNADMVDGLHANQVSPWKKNSTNLFYNNGNIGIGTANPEKKLHIEGEAISVVGGVTNYMVPKGAIIMWSGSLVSIPPGWALCDGSNGTPDLRDRFIVGAGSSYSVGSTGGEATHILTIAEMPSHSHTIFDPGHRHEIGDGNSGGTFWKAVFDSSGSSYLSGIAMTGITINSTGGNAAHENRPPYYALAYIMKL